MGGGVWGIGFANRRFLIVLILTRRESKRLMGEFCFFRRIEIILNLSFLVFEDFFGIDFLDIYCINYLF
jgi:hypothetical protein